MKISSHRDAYLPKPAVVTFRRSPPSAAARYDGSSKTSQAAQNSPPLSTWSTSLDLAEENGEITAVPSPAEMTIVVLAHLNDINEESDERDCRNGRNEGALLHRTGPSGRPLAPPAGRGRIRDSSRYFLGGQLFELPGLDDDLLDEDEDDDVTEAETDCSNCSTCCDHEEEEEGEDDE